jgi:predicted nucleic acid-binding protein
MENNNVLVDSNILINDFLARTKNERISRDAMATMQVLIWLRKKSAKFYVASFSILHLISTIQKSRKNIVSVKDLAHELRRIIDKYEVINVEQSDFENCIAKHQKRNTHRH